MKGKMGDPGNGTASSSDELPDEVVEGFLRVLESVRVEDMPCSQVFSRLDEYVERELRDHEAARLMPLLREHFDVCHECCEEYEALLRAMEGSSDEAAADTATPEPPS